MSSNIVTDKDGFGFLLTRFCGPAHEMRYQIFVADSGGVSGGVQLTEKQMLFLVESMQDFLPATLERSQLAANYRELNGKLREFCEFRGLGHGGEDLVDLALDYGRNKEREAARHLEMLYRIEKLIADLRAEIGKVK